MLMANAPTAFQLLLLCTASVPIGRIDSRSDAQCNFRMQACAMRAMLWMSRCEEDAPGEEMQA